MKIKTTKKMRLDELIEHEKKSDLDKNIFRKHISTCGTYEVRLNGKSLDYIKKLTSSNLQALYCPNMPFDTLFNVKVKEELTKDTKFHKLLEVSHDEKYQSYQFERRNVSINMITEEDSSTCSNVLAVFHGDILIWSHKDGIPDEGVIEA